MTKQFDTDRVTIREKYLHDLTVREVEMKAVGYITDGTAYLEDGKICLDMYAVRKRSLSDYDTGMIVGD